MQMKRMKCALSCILCAVLIVAMTLVTAGCSGNATKTSGEVTGEAVMTDGAVLGEGANVFKFTVVDVEGKSVTGEIHTDKTIVGEALQELGVIAGEQGQYGLYVKTVNGITLDYDKDGKYWAFYVNDGYASAGVDQTNIEAGVTYSFKAE